MRHPQGGGNTMQKKPYSILDYHTATVHTRGAITGRTLNRDNAPIPFKFYREVPTFHLPHELAHPEVALDKSHLKQTLPVKPNMPVILGAICNLAAGITVARQSGDEVTVHMRAAASAGALYPTELYVALQNVTGMNDGMYHYNPLQHTLSHLRAGYVFGALSGSSPIIRFYLTSIYHRSAWKYGPRAYRYCLLDTGHLLENLRLGMQINGFPARIDYDFNDKAVTRFLGIDPEYEGCLAVIHSLGCGSATEEDETVLPTAPDIASFSRVAPKADAPEEVLAAHTATSSFARCPIKKNPELLDNATPLAPPVVPASTASAILTRRSRRNFIPNPKGQRSLADILSMICQDVAPQCSNGLNVGILAGENSGFTPGYHTVNKGDCSTTLVKAGNLMGKSARVCLDQGWLENAAMHVLFTANLQKLNKECGPRSYRYTHLEAGRLGELVYLAATGKQLGACGIGAFFDKDAVQLLGLPSGEVLLYLVAVGPVRK